MKRTESMAILRNLHGSGLQVDHTPMVKETDMRDRT